MHIKSLLPVCFFMLISGALYAQYGCTDPAASNYNPGATINDGSCIYPVTHDNPVLRCALQSSLKESSGVVWSDGKLWTHNDSGNPNSFFSIDTSNGGTLQKIFIDNYANNDWEDIAADNNYIYIEDAGNNNGTRTNLKILKVAKSSIGSAPTVHVNAEAIAFSYADQTNFSSNSNNNYDCESIISIGDSLYLFTKDRGDLKTRVYRLPKIPGTYSIAPYTNYNVNGLITGADYNAVKNEVVLIGYMTGALNPFIWVLNDFQGVNFFSGNKRRIEIGNGKEWQTEGICYISDNRFFISCEKSNDIEASLFVDNKIWVAAGIYEKHLSIDSFVFPNPTTDEITVSGIHFTKAILRDISGKMLKEKKLFDGNTVIDLRDLPKGIYLMELVDQLGNRRLGKICKQ